MRKPANILWYIALTCWLYLAIFITISTVPELIQLIDALFSAESTNQNIESLVNIQKRVDLELQIQALEQLRDLNVNTADDELLKSKIVKEFHESLSILFFCVTAVVKIWFNRSR